jgi:hypothetical protein
MDNEKLLRELLRTVEAFLKRQVKISKLRQTAREIRDILERREEGDSRKERPKI